jgi:hypothetical protein
MCRNVITGTTEWHYGSILKLDHCDLTWGFFMKARLLCAVLAFCSCGMAQKDGQPSLAGIKTVYVMVQPYVDAAVPGLAADVIKRDVASVDI